MAVAAVNTEGKGLLPEEALCRNALSCLEAPGGGGGVLSDKKDHLQKLSMAIW